MFQPITSLCALRRGACLLLLLHALAGQTALAQAPATDPVNDYDALLNQAITASADKRYLEARELFARAHALSPTARTHRALGVVAVALTDYTTAKRELEAALAAQTLPLTEEQRNEVSHILAWMRESLSILRLRTTPSDAQVELDGKACSCAESWLQPGNHQLVVFAPGFERQEHSVTLGAAEQLALHVVLPKPTAAPATAAPTPAPALLVASPAPAADGGQAVLWPWLGGGGALALAAGITLGVFGANDIAAVEKAERGTPLSELRGPHDRAPWLTGAGIALGAVGIAAIAWAGVELLSQRSGREKAGVSWAAGPSGIALDARF